MKKQQREKRRLFAADSTAEENAAPLAAPLSAGPNEEAERSSLSRTPRSLNAAFPIVGIGASAGGLEALERLLRYVPPASGLAFVIVQHLDPSHEDLMVEILQRATGIPVLRIADRMRVEPNHIYVIPPNRDLSILHGVLHLFEPAAPRGSRLPIDFFLRSLADDRRHASIAIILSGMGSDGTLGLRAIKEKAGAVFVQDPATAKYDSMPRSAIDSGLADVVAPAEELADRILAYLRHVSLFPGEPEPIEREHEKSGLEKVLFLLRAYTGQDFSLYKKSTIYRRIERRKGLHQLASISDYVRCLRENPSETELLFKELLIGVTSFFRDPPVWDQLRDEAIPALLASRPGGGTLRAWVSGCSTGEEAYSLAIVFREALEKARCAGRFSLQIFATDLDKDAVEKARAGFYPANITADVDEKRLRRDFSPEEQGFRICKEIRAMVIFAPQNVIMDPPFTRLDLVSCRNLLIYFESELQKKILRLFHYSLNPGGLLVLGSSETIGQATELFAPLPGKTRLFKRLGGGQQFATANLPSVFAQPKTLLADSLQRTRTFAPTSNLQALVEELLLRCFAPAAVLTTDNGDILYFSGKTGAYLEPAAGKANLNVFAMAREGLCGALSEAFAKAVREKTTITLSNLRVGSAKGESTTDVSVHFLCAPEGLRGTVLIVFAAAALTLPTPKGKKEGMEYADAQVAALTDALKQSREEIQNAREEMQSSQEELKSANEELQSTNEELQSTNEELTTSKEEIQSMNEELQTVNHELQAKVDELSRSGDDMKNLLNGTDIATLFLDLDLKVRRFTTRVRKSIV